MIAKSFKWVSNPLNWIPFIIFALGLVVMRVDARMSHKFGMSFDGDAALGLTAISIASGFLLIVVVQQWREGNKNVAKCLMGAWALVFTFNVISNMGVATSVRVAETQNSNLKMQVHTEQAKSKDEAKARLATFEKQLAMLIEKNGWAATVTASGLQSQVASLRQARDSEAALGGCGSKCRSLETQITEINGKIAVAEQRQNLDSRIAATKAVLAEARTTLAASDGGVSLVANQASLYSRWTVGWFGDGESVGVVRNSNEVLGMFMALVIAAASVALTLAGAWPHLMAISPGTANAVGSTGFLSSDGSSPQGSGFLSASILQKPNAAPRDTSLAAAIREACKPMTT